MNLINSMQELTPSNAELTSIPNSNLDELKKLSKQLIETESTLSAFWHLSPSLKCIACDGRFVKINPAWSRLLGYTPEELLNNDYKSFIHPDDINPTIEIESELSDNKSIFSFRNRYRHKTENRWITIEWTASQEGKLIYASGTDKTLEVAQECKLKKLLEEAEVLKNAIDHSNNGVIITDPNKDDNPIIYVNKMFEHITGYPITEVLEKNCRFLDGEADVEAKQAIKDAIRLKKPYKGYVKNTKKDGSHFINYLKISPIFNNKNELINFIASISDCTTEYYKMDLMETALANAPFGVFLSDDSGDCLYINKKWEELSGLSPNEAKGKGWIEGLCDHSKTEVSDAWYKFAEKAKEDHSLNFYFNSCFHNRKTDILTNVKIHAYFYNHSTKIGYIEIQPIHT